MMKFMQYRGLTIQPKIRLCIGGEKKVFFVKWFTSNVQYVPNLFTPVP